MGVIKLNWREMGRGIGKEKGGEVEGEEVACVLFMGEKGATENFHYEKPQGTTLF